MLAVPKNRQSAQKPKLRTPPPTTPSDLIADDDDRRVAARGAKTNVMSRRDMRRRVRAARRNAQIVYGRGGFLPKTTWGVAGWLAAFALGVGLASAFLFTYFDAKFDSLGSGLEERIERAAPRIGSRAAAPGSPSNRKPTEAAVLVGDQPVASATPVATSAERTWWLANLAQVRPATIEPPAPLALDTPTGRIDAVAWTWNDDDSLVLIAADLGDQVVRDLAPTPHDGAAVSYVRSGPDGRQEMLLPATVLRTEHGRAILTGPSEAVPSGTAVVTGDGALVGVVLHLNHDGTVTVATTAAACQSLLSCGS